MFENSLIALDTRKFQRPRWLSMPVAVAFHVVAGTAVGFGQYWQIAEVPEPPLNVVFFQMAAPPPPPPPAPAPAPRPTPQPPPRPTAPVADVQPRDIPEDIPDAPANEDIGVVDLVPGSVTVGPGVPNSVFTGPGNGHSEGPGVIEAPAPKDEILTVGGAVSKPVFQDGPKPKYTEVARKARLQGTVIVEAIIDEQGRVIDARVLKGLPMGLDREAVAAVQQWRYKPATYQGRPVKVRFSLTVNFQVN